ncbi:sensor histidine kinase [Roseivirga sp.]|uniref:sensor histidine kinase n=1 Tax=Roseivirga sp. TaxID=1964215 RepID=UPI003B8AB260
MTRVRIRWLIGLLSFALLGLVGFQYYWITEVTKVNKERFNQSVNEALNEVTQTLAIEQGVSFLEANMGTRPPLRRADQPVYRDSLRNASNVNNPETVSASPMPSPPEEFVQAFFRVQLDERNGQILIELDIEGLSRALPNNYAAQGIDPRQQQLQMERQLNTLKRRWANHLAGSEQLFTRIDPLKLDTLIAQGLENRGVNIPYNYGILHAPSNELKLFNANQESDRESVKSSELKVNLFPMDLIDKEFYLAIDFPKQKSYLSNKAIIPLSASGLLLILVIGCFGYAIMVILKQKKISEIKSDFVNNMTHEFKTPIATVSLATEALQDNDMKGNPAIVDRYVQVIRDENKRLGMQVEKVLQIASLDKKDFKLKFEEIDIHGVIEKALVNINILVEKRGGQVTSQLHASNSVLEADPVHLTNIIYNLLDNANKYSPEPPQIHIRTDNISSGIILKITDAGIGMSKEAIEKIFEKFYRVSTGNVHDVKGFGLGLSYVKTIVDMHAGSVNVKSELGKGSTFKIFLPFNHG